MEHVVPGGIMEMYTKCAVVPWAKQMGCHAVCRCTKHEDEIWMNLIIGLQQRNSGVGFGQRC